MTVESFGKMVHVIVANRFEQLAHRQLAFDSVMSIDSGHST